MNTKNSRLFLELMFSIYYRFVSVYVTPGIGIPRLGNGRLGSLSSLTTTGLERVLN